MSDKLVLGEKEITSRLFIGTGKFPSNAMIPDVIKKSGTHMVTAAIRRIDFNSQEENMLNYIPKECILIPNTSGARNAEEALRIANLARELGCGNFIKIEVIADNKYLFPDNQETIKATKILVKEGFVVLPYMTPDLMDAKRLEDAGAAAVMPLGSPIGTNKGLRTRDMIKILIDEIDVPIIVDAGIGKPSEACEAMELGAAAVLVNTAIATAGDPVLMAKAFAKAVKAGRYAFLSGVGAEREFADASSPLTGFLG
ncbi:MAG: thiazole synthase [Clostridium sp.]|nr:thiazole synthase [Clostridium sp.]